MLCRFVKVLALVTDDKVLVHLAGFRIGNEPLPYADVIFVRDDVSFSIPVIELTYNRYALCIRSPHCEVGSVYSVDGGGVRTELLIKIVVRSMTEKILIQFSENRYSFSIGLPLLSQQKLLLLILVHYAEIPQSIQGHYMYYYKLKWGACKCISCTPFREIDIQFV